jgi:hypothetical protein
MSIPSFWIASWGMFPALAALPRFSCPWILPHKLDLTYTNVSLWKLAESCVKIINKKMTNHTKEHVSSVKNDHIIAYPTPPYPTLSNVNYFWGFGSSAGLRVVSRAHSACCSLAIPHPFALKIGQEPHYISLFSSMQTELVFVFSSNAKFCACSFLVPGRFTHLPNFTFHASPCHNSEHRIWSGTP